MSGKQREGSAWRREMVLAEIAKSGVDGIGFEAIAGAIVDATRDTISQTTARLRRAGSVAYIRKGHVMLYFRSQELLDSIPEERRQELLKSECHSVFKRSGWLASNAALTARYANGGLTDIGLPILRTERRRSVQQIVSDFGVGGATVVQVAEKFGGSDAAVNRTHAIMRDMVLDNPPNLWRINKFRATRYFATEAHYLEALKTQQDKPRSSPVKRSYKVSKNRPAATPFADAVAAPVSIYASKRGPAYSNEPAKITSDTKVTICPNRVQYAWESLPCGPSANLPAIGSEPARPWAQAVMRAMSAS